MGTDLTQYRGHRSQPDVESAYMNPPLGIAKLSREAKRAEPCLQFSSADLRRRELMLLYRIFLRQAQPLLHSPAAHQEVPLNTVRTSANALVSCRGGSQVATSSAFSASL